MSLRAVAEATTISAATLSRFESGKGNPDLATLSKLVLWLELDQRDVYGGPADVDHAELDTPAAVEVHLRADRKLDPQTATALAEGFRAMYERFANDEPAREIQDSPPTS